MLSSYQFLFSNLKTWHETQYSGAYFPFFDTMTQSLCPCNKDTKKTAFCCLLCFLSDPRATPAASEYREVLTGSRNGRGDTSCRFSNEMSHDTSTQSTCLLALHLLTSESLPESPNQVVVRTWLSRQEQPGNWSSAEQSYLRPKKRENF